MPVMVMLKAAAVAVAIAGVFCSYRGVGLSLIRSETTHGQGDELLEAQPPRASIHHDQNDEPCISSHSHDLSSVMPPTRSKGQSSEFVSWRNPVGASQDVHWRLGWVSKPPLPDKLLAEKKTTRLLLPSLSPSPLHVHRPLSPFHHQHHPHSFAERPTNLHDP